MAIGHRVRLDCYPFASLPTSLRSLLSGSKSAEDKIEIHCTTLEGPGQLKHGVYSFAEFTYEMISLFQLAQ